MQLVIRRMNVSSERLLAAEERLCFTELAGYLVHWLFAFLKLSDQPVRWAALYEIG
jgi:hypothetical protein